LHLRFFRQAYSACLPTFLPFLLDDFALQLTHLLVDLLAQLLLFLMSVLKCLDLLQEFSALDIFLLMRFEFSLKLAIESFYLLLDHFVLALISADFLVLFLELEVHVVLESFDVVL